MTRLRSFLLAVSICAASQATGATTQHTEGWCSPAVAGVGGNVSIVCQGVDPKALKRLNELLDIKDKQLSEKIAEATAWARRYKELERRLQSTPQAGADEARAVQLLREGRLEEAGRVLDALLADEDEVLRRYAARNYNRAQVYSLQFESAKALPYYAKAHRYDPQNAEYILSYAENLTYERRYAEATRLFGELLPSAPGKQPAVEASLAQQVRAHQGLANVARGQRNSKAAGEHLQAAIRALRTLSAGQASPFRFELAKALNEYAPYAAMRQIGTTSDAIAAWKESAGLFEQLAADDPAKRNYYMAYCAGSLMSLAMMGRVFRLLKKGEVDEYFDRVIEIHDRIRAESPSFYTAEMAGSFLQLSSVYLMRRRYDEAAEKIAFAIDILEKTSPSDPMYLHLPSLYAAQHIILKAKHDDAGALAAALKGVEHARKLMRRSPRRFAPLLAQLLSRAADSYYQLGRKEDAERARSEAQALLGKAGLR